MTDTNPEFQNGWEAGVGESMGALFALLPTGQKVGMVKALTQNVNGCLKDANADYSLEWAEVKDIHKGTMNSHEVLYGFLGWLTTRETPVTFSSGDDASAAVILIAEFEKFNSLPEVRDGWENSLTHPSGAALAN